MEDPRVTIRIRSVNHEAFFHTRYVCTVVQHLSLQLFLVTIQPFNKLSSPQPPQENGPKSIKSKKHVNRIYELLYNKTRRYLSALKGLFLHQRNVTECQTSGKCFFSFVTSVQVDHLNLFFLPPHSKERSQRVHLYGLVSQL